MRANKKRLISVIAGLLALVMTAAALCACGEKPSIVKTEEGKKLTAKKWQTNYFPNVSDEVIVEKIEHLGNKIPFEKKLNIVAGNGYFKKKQR